MKYIVVGLGSFGASLAEKLTAYGNEVIGVDKVMAKVEIFKERISHTICMDSTDEITVSGLPLNDTDMVIITIGEDRGSNVMTTALFKNLEVKRLMSRAIDSLHEKVLNAIGVDEIVYPEAESAERWAKKLSLKGVVDSFELSDEYSIIEVNVPEKYDKMMIKDTKIRETFNLLVLTSMCNTETKSTLGKTQKSVRVNGVASASDVLSKDDILVVYGANKDIQRFLKAT